MLYVVELRRERDELSAIMARIREWLPFADRRYPRSYSTSCLGSPSVTLAERTASDVNREALAALRA